MKTGSRALIGYEIGTIDEMPTVRVLFLETEEGKEIFALSKIMMTDLADSLQRQAATMKEDKTTRATN